MTNYEKIIASMDLYGVNGTNFGDSVKMGSFAIPGFSMQPLGVKGTDVRVYNSYPIDYIDKEIWSFTQATGANGLYYIPLASSVTATENTFGGPFDFADTQRFNSVFTPTQTDLSVDYPVERVLEITSTTAFSVNLSGYTRFDEKIVCAGAAVDVDGTFTFTTVNGVAAVSSIGITATPPFTITVNATNAVMLPYTDFGDKGNLILATVLDDASIPFTLGDVTQITPKYQYTTAEIIQTNITANTGNIRPIIAWAGEDVAAWVVWQNINPNVLGNYYPNTITEAVDLNKIENLAGLTPYSEGWVNWKG